MFSNRWKPFVTSTFPFPSSICIALLFVTSTFLPAHPPYTSPGASSFVSEVCRQPHPRRQQVRRQTLSPPPAHQALLQLAARASLRPILDLKSARQTNGSRIPKTSANSATLGDARKFRMIDGELKRYQSRARRLHCTRTRITTSSIRSKYACLYPPSETPKLYPRGVDDAEMKNNSSLVEVKYSRPSSLGKSIDMDAIKELERLYPLLKEAEYADAVLGPDECLYILLGWWHYVESLSIGSGPQAVPEEDGWSFAAGKAKRLPLCCGRS
ncbi:hypothetical protein LTR08_004464 [Meristemomyces frigidus]|nr:hypothetical protein LTR08_004464 [Meristemomyces frigidus]